MLWAGVKQTQTHPHLTSKELVQMPQLFAVGHISVQGGFQLLAACGPADQNGGVADSVPAGLLVRVLGGGGQCGGRF